jgi:hypothetical protein
MRPLGRDMESGRTACDDVEAGFTRARDHVSEQRTNVRRSGSLVESRYGYAGQDGFFSLRREIPDPASLHWSDRMKSPLRRAFP